MFEGAVDASLNSAMVCPIHQKTCYAIFSVRVAQPVSRDCLWPPRRMSDDLEDAFRECQSPNVRSCPQRSRAAFQCAHREARSWGQRQVLRWCRR